MEQEFPTIEPADQLQFTRLKNAWLESRLKEADCRKQIEMFGSVLFQKYNVDASRATMNDEPAFVKRG